MFLTGRTVETPPAVKELRPKKSRKRISGRSPRPRKRRCAPRPPLVQRPGPTGGRGRSARRAKTFANAIVNASGTGSSDRAWSMPLDLMLTRRTCLVHPELLGWLAHDLVEHRYDLRRLIRGLVLSRAYARSSVWQEGE